MGSAADKLRVLARAGVEGAKRAVRIPRNVLSCQAVLVNQPRMRSDLSLIDFIIAMVMAAAAALMANWAATRLGTSLERMTSQDVWFQADTTRVIANLIDRSSNHYRVSVHPIASILLTPVTLCLRKVGVDLGVAVHALMGLMASLSIGLFFIFFRLLTLPRAAAMVFTAMAISSAAFVHWSPVIELSLASMLTIVLALIALAYGRTRNMAWWILMNCATLGITITNWSFGIIATLVRWPLRRFLIICIAAAMIVSILATAQHVLFKNARPFFLGGAVDEYQWTQPVLRGGADWSPANSLRSLFISTIVAPRPYVEIREDVAPRPDAQNVGVVTNQKAGFFDRTTAGIAAAFVWLALFGIGVWGGLRTTYLRPVSAGLILMVLSQAAIHIVYGDPTFLYALHFMPVLIAIASISWFTSLRWIAFAGALVVTILGGVSNVEQFEAAASLAAASISEGGANILEGGELPTWLY